MLWQTEMFNYWQLCSTEKISVSFGKNLPMWNTEGFDCIFSHQAVLWLKIPNQSEMQFFFFPSSYKYLFACLHCDLFHPKRERNKKKMSYTLVSLLEP